MKTLLLCIMALACVACEGGGGGGSDDSAPMEPAVLSLSDIAGTYTLEDFMWMHETFDITADDFLSFLGTMTIDASGGVTQEVEVFDGNFWQPATMFADFRITLEDDGTMVATRGGCSYRVRYEQFADGLLLDDRAFYRECFDTSFAVESVWLAEDVDLAANH